MSGPSSSVSVVVPTADRPRELAVCLEALGRLDAPPGGLEIVVVDDGGGAEVPRGVRLVRDAPRRGPAAARNSGARAAEGDVLAFTDDDCRPDPGWLRAIVQCVSPGTAAGGHTVNALGDNPFAEASQHIAELVDAHYNRDTVRFVASNNLAVGRSDFLDLGGFDPSFPFASEDRDFCDRWRASGRVLRFARDAVVRHAHDLDLAGFVEQHMAYGRGAARYHAARAGRGTGRLRDDMPFHLDASLYRRTLALRPARRAAKTIALLALWQAANAAGYVLERPRVA